MSPMSLALRILDIEDWADRFSDKAGSSSSSQGGDAASHNQPLQGWAVRNDDDDEADGGGDAMQKAGARGVVRSVIEELAEEAEDGDEVQQQPLSEDAEPPQPTANAAASVPSVSRGGSCSTDNEVVARELLWDEDTENIDDDAEDEKNEKGGSVTITGRNRSWFAPMKVSVQKRSFVGTNIANDTQFASNEL